MAGMAYSGHRKVAVGSDGGPRIGRGPEVVSSLTVLKMTTVYAVW